MNTGGRAVSYLPESPELRHRVALDAYDAKRYSEALRLAQHLIDEGFGHANALAGALYEEGGYGIEQDLSKARFYYERSIEEVGSVEGWLALGRLYFFGKGVAQDYERALAYYKAVDEDVDSAIAQLMLGRIYKDGCGVARDLSKAREYLRRSASKGNVFANSYLAALEGSVGRWPASLWLRAKAIVLAFWITWTDPTSPRLRIC